jgi:hypothetical protein
MVDREKVLTVLRRRFPDATSSQLAAAANAIVGLDDDWEVVEPHNLANLVDHIRRGAEFRLLERRHDAGV